MTDWGGVFSASQGLPGAAFIRKKVMHATMNTVKTAMRTRFMVYFTISSLPNHSNALYIPGGRVRPVQPHKTVRLFYRKTVTQSRVNGHGIDGSAVISCMCPHHKYIFAPCCPQKASATENNCPRHALFPSLFARGPGNSETIYINFETIFALSLFCATLIKCILRL